MSDTTDIESWTCNTTDALKICLALEDKAIKFPATFTYALFGDAEQVYGYKDLKIDLAVDCKTLLPLLAYSYSSKKDGVNTIEETFSKYLGEGFIINDEEKWIKKKEAEPFDFKDIEEKFLFHEYKRKGKQFKIFKIGLQEDIGKLIMSRLQLFSLLYIEGGSCIDLEDPVWEVLIIYDCTTADAPIFTGFATVYKYWKFNNSKENDDGDFKFRYTGKISQVVLLPAFQGNGHGSEIYESILLDWERDNLCYGITVEDPSEEFDNLRDKSDLKMILSGKCKSNKLAKRQRERMEEILTAIKGDVEGAKKMVKKRVYLANKEGLADWTPDDIKAKLEEVWTRVWTEEISVICREFRGQKHKLEAA